MDDAPTPRPRFSVAENICDVLANDWINTDYKRLLLRAGPVAIAAQPGQFFHLACPAAGSEQPLLRRPMSVYRVDPAADELAFLYKVQGAGTRGLATLRPGDRLDAFGPLGRGFVLPPAARHVLMLARGVGLATMAPLAARAIAEGASVTAVLSARSAALLMSVDELRDAGARVIPVTDEDGSSDVARVETLLRRLHDEQAFDLLTTCGSNRLLLLLQSLGAAWGVPGQVALEQHMGCAIGMCFACVRSFRKAAGSDALTYRRVCWEGPVFDLQETVSW